MDAVQEIISMYGSKASGCVGRQHNIRQYCVSSSLRRRRSFRRARHNRHNFSEDSSSKQHHDWTWNTLDTHGIVSGDLAHIVQHVDVSALAKDGGLDLEDVSSRSEVMQSEVCWANGA